MLACFPNQSGTELWQWKVLILDEESKKIIDNVVKEDDILNHNIASMCVGMTYVTELRLDRR
jgi:hypothetical protein